MKRLLFKTWHNYKGDRGENRGQYYLNNYPDMALKVNYDLPFQKAETWNDVIDAYILIERFIRLTDKESFNDDAIHLYDEFLSVSNLVKDITQHLKTPDIERIGRLFIRLFDTLPLYSQITTNEEWRLMFHAKYLATMLIRNGQIHLNRTKGELQRWRYKMQTEYLVEFQTLMK